MVKTDSLVQMTRRQVWGEISIYVLFFFLLCWCLQSVDFSTGDDTWFAAQAHSRSLSEFLKWRYATWTSRLLIEGALVLSVTGEPMIWRVLTALFITVVAIGVVRLTTPGGVGFAALGCLLLGLIPRGVLSSAGWVATSVNYIWVAGCGMVALFPLKRVLTGGTLRWWEFPLYVLPMIYAVNHEQMAFIFFGAYGIGLGYCVRNGQKYSQLVLFFLVVCGGMLFAATAPGNTSRLAAETAKWAPKFAGYSPIKKAILGWFSTSSYYFAGGGKNLVFVGLSTTLLVSLVALRRSPVTVMIGAIPALFSIGVGHVIRSVTNNGGRSVLLRILFDTGKARRADFGSFEYLAACGIYIAVFGCFVYGLYRLFGSDRRLLVVSWVIVLGGLSRICMGYSPTLYISGYRTTLFCSLAIIMVTLLVARRVREADEYRGGAVIFCVSLVTLIYHLTNESNLFG